MQRVDLVMAKRQDRLAGQSRIVFMMSGGRQPSGSMVGDLVVERMPPQFFKHQITSTKHQIPATFTAGRDHRYT
jgi:hypothetical protein